MYVHHMKNNRQGLLGTSLKLLALATELNELRGANKMIEGAEKITVM